MAEHHDDFVHVPHDNLEDFDKNKSAQADASTLKSTMDIPIPPARNAPGSDPEGAAGAPTASANAGSVPSWLVDKDQGAAGSARSTQSPLQYQQQQQQQQPFGGIERGRDLPTPVVDLTKDYTPHHQQQDAPRQSFIREVPRSTRDESAVPEQQPSQTRTPTSSIESRTAPPPSKFSEITRTDDASKKTEGCPLPIPNLMDFMDKNVSPKVQYVLYYKDPVYSLLVLGGVAGFLYFLMSGYTYKLLWLASFLLKWTMLTAFAVSGGHYAYKRYVQKVPNPVHYGERHFKPRIEPLVARFAPYMPPQDWFLDKLNCAVRLAFRAPRKFLDTIYSNNWGAMFRGLVALQVIQSLFCCLSPRGLVWFIFGLICTVPKIYQMFRGPIDSFIHFFHEKLTAICHALQHTKQQVKPAVATEHAPAPAKSPFPATVTTTILTVPAGMVPTLAPAATVTSPEVKKEQ